MSWNSTIYTAIRVGFEDMTVDFTAGTSAANGTFGINFAYASWIKGVRFIGSNASSCCGLLLGSFANSLYMNNYYFATNPLTLASEGLPIEPTGHSAVLFLNNFTQGGGISSMEQQGWNSGTYTHTTMQEITRPARRMQATLNTQRRRILNYVKETFTVNQKTTNLGNA